MLIALAIYVEVFKGFVAEEWLKLLGLYHQAISNPQLLFTAAGVLSGVAILLLLSVLWSLRKKGNASKGNTWMPDYVQKMKVEDALQDALDKLFLEKQISGKMRRKSMHEIGNKTVFTGLTTMQIVRQVKLHAYKANILKQSIQKRILSGFYKKKPKLPGDPTPPPWDITPVATTKPPEVTATRSKDSIAYAKLRMATLWGKSAAAA